MILFALFDHHLIAFRAKNHDNVPSRIVLSPSRYREWRTLADDLYRKSGLDPEDSDGGPDTYNYVPIYCSETVSDIELRP